MNVQRAVCASCAAAMDVPAGVQQVRCEYCGSTFQVERSAGQATLIAATEIGRAVQDSGAAMQEELRRLQLGQELSAAGMQLMQLQAEIRGLERSKLDNRGKRQLFDLRRQERSLQTRIYELQKALNPPKVESNQKTTARQEPRKDGCVSKARRLLFGWKVNVPLGSRRLALPVVFTGLLLCCCLSSTVSVLTPPKTYTSTATRTPTLTATVSPKVTPIPTKSVMPTDAPTTAPTTVLMRDEPVRAPSPATATAAAQATEAAYACLNASYEADVTIPDGTRFDTNASFVKTWRVKNTGKCDWNQGVVIALESGDKLAACRRGMSCGFVAIK